MLAEELTETRGSDGSNRIIELLATCDVAFVGDIVAELGRPQTNVEQFIADPANDITPNQAQIDVLDNELSLYWRIALTAAPQLATVPTSVDTTTPGGSDASTSSTPGTGSVTTPGTGTTGTTGTTAGDDDDSSGSGSGDDDGSSGSGGDDGGGSGPG